MVDADLRRICRVLAQAETVAALGTLVLLLLLETMLLTVTVMFRDILLMLMLIFKEMLGLLRQEWLLLEQLRLPVLLRLKLLRLQLKVLPRAELANAAAAAAATAAWQKQVRVDRERGAAARDELPHAFGHKFLRRLLLELLRLQVLLRLPERHRVGSPLRLLEVSLLQVWHQVVLLVLVLLQKRQVVHMLIWLKLCSLLYQRRRMPFMEQALWVHPAWVRFKDVFMHVLVQRRPLLLLLLLLLLMFLPHILHAIAGTRSILGMEWLWLEWEGLLRA